MARKIKKKRKKSTRGYTLKDQIVKDYIKFRAIPEYIRKDGIETQEDFLVAHGLSKKSSKSLHNITKKEGFAEAVEKEKANAGKEFIKIADMGLYKRGKGLKIIIQKVTPQGGVVDCEEELPPDTKACVEIHKIFGKYEEKIRLKGEISVLDMLKEVKSPEEESVPKSDTDKEEDNDNG